MGYPRAVHYAAALALTLSITPAPVAAATGNDLLRQCVSDDRSIKGMCMGYITGVVHGAMVDSFARSSSPLFCQPKNMDSEQRVDVILKWLRENPKERGADASSLILIAMVTEYPCPKK